MTTHQASIELALSQGGELVAIIPPHHAGAHASTFTVPATADGLAIIRRVLKARQAASANGASMLVGTEASPVQGMIEEWLRHHQPTRQVAPTSLDVEGLGL